MKRSEVDIKNTWDLTVLFENDEKWSAEYKALSEAPEKVAAYKGKISQSAKDLYDFLKLDDEMAVRLGALHGYASCKSDEDTANGFYADFRGKAMSTYVAVSEASAFFTPEIMDIPEERLNSFYEEVPELKEYKRIIDKIRRRKAHILSSECEKLLASAGEMADSPDNIGGILRNADMRFPKVTDGNGNEHELTDGTFVPLLESPDRELRRAAFEAYYGRLGEFKNTIAATFDAQFKQLNFFARARKYSGTLEASLDNTEVPVEVYKNLISAVHKNLDKMYAYVSLRKQLLGVDGLHMYDVYTPIVADTATKIEFEDAKSTVLDALSVLGSDYIEILSEGFNNRWIDVYENEGKRGGAYCTGTGRPHPFVLLNHKDNLDSMFTIAHEMGHALHSYYSTKYQPICTSDYVIFVAEVASTVNEILLMKYLLAKTEDRNEKAYLINHFLDQFKGTVYRQTMFAEFELWMGEMSENGETLTADLLANKYRELNALYYGPDMVSDEGIALEWARIPHFFYNYYVFQYATGFSAAVAIANRILKEGEAAVEDYKSFLKSGGSADPISLLKIAGVDMSSPAPIDSALDYFGELIEEIKRNI